MQLDVTNAGRDDGFPTSVLRELSHLKSLDHCNIAKVYKAEVQDKIVRICFEHLSLNLKQYIQLVSMPTEPSKESDIQFKLQPCEIKRIMWQLLKAVTYCHSKGLMHRNLKPDNILMNQDGELKLSDFTLSRMGVQPEGSYTPEDPKE